MGDFGAAASLEAHIEVRNLHYNKIPLRTYRARNSHEEGKTLTNPLNSSSTPQYAPGPWTGGDRETQEAQDSKQMLCLA